MQKKRTFKAAFTCRWAPSDGKDGQNGQNGQNGKDGVGIKTADVVFKLSTSDTPARQCRLGHPFLPIAAEGANLRLELHQDRTNKRNHDLYR